MLSSKRRITLKLQTVRDRRYSVPCPNTHYVIQFTHTPTENKVFIYWRN